MKHWATALLLAVGAAPSLAHADETSPCRSEAAALVAEDANQDGQVTLLEVRAAALGLFEHFDRDGDGVVVRSEADAVAGSWRARRLELRFAALDRDRDGVLARGEMKLGPRRWARADRNGDGRLTRAEVAHTIEQPGGGHDTAALRSMFWRRDGNHDGRVTRAEMLSAADRRFMRRDRDRNGVVAARGERTKP